MKSVSLIELWQTFIAFKDLFIEPRGVSGYQPLCSFDGVWEAMSTPGNSFA